MESNFGSTMASIPQSWDWLKNRGDKDDKVFRRMWKAVETKIEKTRITKTEGRRKEAKKRRKNKKGENNESKKMAEE